MRHNYLIMALAVAALTCGAQGDFNTEMMLSTFQIVGPSSEHPNAVMSGTVFLMVKPSVKHPGNSLKVMFTANHVLAGIGGQSANVNFRVKNPDGSWHKKPLTFSIRNGTNNLWTTGKESDIAAMFLPIPDELMPECAVSTGMLATEQDLLTYEIHPGDQLSCLGYPLGLEGNDAGFPVLRMGTVASYPLTPVHNYPTFLFNFDVFGGNSGGPVYLDYIGRAYGGSIHADKRIVLIAGIVLDEVDYVDVTKTLREDKTTKTPLALSKVIHAEYMKQLLDSIQEP